jgi:hypothetical protein
MNELSDVNVGSSPMVSPGVMIDVITSMCLLVFMNNYAKQLKSVSAALKSYPCTCGGLALTRRALFGKFDASICRSSEFIVPIISTHLNDYLPHIHIALCWHMLAHGMCDNAPKTRKIETSGLFPLWDAVSSSGGVMLDESLHVLP